MDYFDDLEIRHPEVRQKAIFDALPKQIKNAKNNASGWSKILSEVIPEEITSWEALAKLPITRKCSSPRMLDHFQYCRIEVYLFLTGTHL